MKKILFFLLFLITTQQLLTMDYELQPHTTRYGAISSYSERDEHKNAKDKAKELLNTHIQEFKSSLVQEIGSIRDLESLDLTKHNDFLTFKKAQLLSSYLQEAVEWNKGKEKVNNCIKNPLSPFGLANIAISTFFYLVPLLSTSAHMVFDGNPQGKLDNCISAKFNDCLATIPNNLTIAEFVECVFNCSTIASSDPACQIVYQDAIKKDAHEVFMGKTIFWAGLAFLLTLQAAIQLIRIKFFKPNPNITTETESEIANYNNAINTLQTKNPRINQDTLNEDHRLTLEEV